ncbi:MAG: efflux RND transporter permease subunit, partial [Candidatus Omnitrophica bacterium]|nr:efflux RND transporter permease subunit [Candidatus Omnitrophota bacterium]
MYAISKFSVTHPVLVNLLTVVIVLVGTITFFLLPREIFPYVSTDVIFVETLNPRASADEVEKSITVLLEEEISEVRGIKKMHSTTVEGRSVIILEVETDNMGVTLDKVRRDVETQVEEVTPDLPLEAEKPIVREFVFDVPIMGVSISGAVDEHILKETAHFLKDEIKKIPGVSDINLIGERDEEIWVEIDPLRLYGYGLTLEDVRNAVAMGGLDLAAGLARGTEQEFIVRTKELYTNADDLNRVVLKANREGGRVLVQDIADVKDTFEEATTLGRVNGERSITLDIKQRPGSDTLKITRDVKERLAELEDDLPYGISASYNREIAFMVRERLELLTRNGLLGLVLCLALLRFFLSGRMAMITGLGIPFALMGGLIFMKFMGISLNMISMFSLIMVLGMLVDDGIVVAENTHRYLEKGIDPLTAAIRGSGEVFWSVIAAVATTITAFAPMLFMSGIMGKFCRQIPMVVIFALLASLVEALLVLPVHLAEWSKPNNWKGIWRREPEEMKKNPGFVMRAVAPVGALWQYSGELFDRSPISPNFWFRPLLRGYTRFLVVALRYRYISLLMAFLVAGGIITFAKFHLKFELFKNDDIPVFFINVETPPGTRLEETEKSMVKIENYLKTLPDNYIDAIISRVGVMEDMSTMTMNFGSYRGQIIVDLSEAGERPGLSGQDILDEVRDNMPEIPEIVKTEYQVDSGGPPTGSPVNLRVSGEDYEKLIPIAKEVKQYLETVNGVKDIKDDFEWGKEEFQIDIDRKKASDLGLDVASVAKEVRNAFAGGLATTFTRSREEVEIHVKFPVEYRTSLENIRLMKFRNKDGDLVPFKNFAQVAYGQGISVIHRWNQRKTITVSADVDTDILTSTEVNQMLMGRYGFRSSKDPSITFDYAGENEDTQEAMTSLKLAFIPAMFLNYTIIATVFNSFIQPLVVMSAIPLALLGVVIGLMVHGEPMGFMAMLGAVALVGIVVNDSIILLDFVNKARLRGMSRWHSLLWASKTRVRPIVLTTLTTIGGLMPMLTGLTGTSTFLVPMAISLVYGLLFSTTLLLLYVP